jgi:hypothetical protein
MTWEFSLGIPGRYLCSRMDPDCPALDIIFALVSVMYKRGVATHAKFCLAVS